MAGKARGLSVPSSSTCDIGSLLPLVVAIGATALQLVGVALASLFFYLARAGAGRVQNSVYRFPRVIPEAGQPRSGI